MSGILPPNEADEALLLAPLVQKVRPKLLTQESRGAEMSDAMATSKEEEDLRAALSASLAAVSSSAGGHQSMPSFSFF